MRTWAEINLNNLVHNINILKQLAGESILMPVIKADAYGHGLEKILDTLIFEDIKWVGVATYEEALKVRNKSKDIDVLILGPIENENMKNAIDLDIAFPLTSFSEIEYIHEKNLRPRVHIKIDTGMGRVGFSMNDLDKVRHLLDEKKLINVEAIFSHLSSADTSVEYSEWQLNNFKAITEKFPTVKYKHILNSFGSMQFSNSKYDIIRVGILLFGGIREESCYNYKFKPVMSLKARISFIKILENNSFISYNRQYEGKTGEKIATVSIGYADGLRRDLTNKGEAYLKGYKCPIVGTVCMDQLMIKIPDELEVNVGDTVEFFGEHIHVEDVADKCNTISYEIVCGISQRVPRIYIGEKQ